jgi:LysM repeat protein
LSTPFQVAKGQKISLQKRISKLEFQQIDAQLAVSDVIDPWLHLKQRFLLDYESEKTALSGKALEDKMGNSDIINNGIHKVKEGESIYTIAKDFGVTVLDIIAWNGFDKNVILKSGELVSVSNLKGKKASSPQSIFIPDNQDMQRENILLVNVEYKKQNINNDLIQNDNNETLDSDMINTLEYKAIKGDYVYKLSDTFEVMPDDIIRWNSLKGKAWLYVNDKVLIKKIEGFSYNPRIHTVRKGETLYAISGLYKASIKNLTKWNELNNYTIYQGQDLIVSREGYIPRNIVKDTLMQEDNTKAQDISSEKYEIVENKKKGIDNSTIQENGQTFHIVQEEETIYTIASKYGLTIENLREWNSLPYGQSIVKGQILLIKKVKSENIE